MTLQQQVITDLLTAFPEASTRALARKAYAANPQLFASENSARVVVQKERGVRVSGRVKCPDATPSPFAADPGRPFDTFPEGQKQLDDWGPLILKDRCNALIFADVHIPFHVKVPVVETVKHGKDNGADLILLNGDTLDFFAVSFWEKDPRKRKFAQEIKTGKEFLAHLRAEFPKARIIFKLGNHEERYERYLRVKAPELLDVPDFQMEKLLGFENLGIECVADKRPIRLGDLNVLHGHEYKFAIQNPVNPARGLFLRTKAYAVCGHFHQSSYHTEKTVQQETIATWSTGCLCDLYPEYSPMNNWIHGFAFVEVAENGTFNMNNKVIKLGRVY